MIVDRYRVVLASIVLLAGCYIGPSGTNADAADRDASGSDTDAEANSADAVNHSYVCTQIGSSTADGFFSLRGFRGKLYAGQFGYGREAESMLFRASPWEHVSPGITGVGESICAMREFDGYLYANTENSGDILRSADGENWDVVHDGDGGVIGCGLERHAGYLYAVNYNYATHSHGKILRSQDGVSWSEVWSSGAAKVYLREITSHEDVLYAFGVDEETKEGYALSSANGTDWESTKMPARFFRGHSWKGSLWLGSTMRISEGISGVWRYDGDSEPTIVYPASKQYVTEITDWHGALFAGTSDGWKEDTGTSSLLVSRDGANWDTACTFDEIAVWSVAVVADKLYVGTWQFGSGGNVYRVDLE